MATSLAVPVAYITVLITALAIFSRVYRKRRAAEKRAFEPWFPTHPSRDTYITLLSSPTPVPDTLLKSALLCRAQADVKRIWRMRDDKMALTGLHQRGLVGDETMARFEAAEKELEAELVDVVQEANTFRQGWGQFIFATATEMAQAERTREVVLSIPKMKAAEEKKIARRARYLPNPPTSATTTPIPPASLSTPIKSTTSTGTATTANVTPGAAASTTPSALKAEAASSTPASGSTSTSSSRDASPGPDAALAGSSKGNVGSLGGTPVGTLAGTSGGGGSGSAQGTPSKSTPGKKKKGKK